MPLPYPSQHPLLPFAEEVFLKRSSASITEETVPSAVCAAPVQPEAFAPVPVLDCLYSTRYTTVCQNVLSIQQKTRSTALDKTGRVGYNEHKGGAAGKREAPPV